MNAQIAEGAATDVPLLSASEQLSLGLRLTLSLGAAGCLAVAGIIRWFRPEQQSVAELAVGLGAALVAVPALTAAWRSLRHTTLHGIMDQLIALALLGAWAAGDLVTAALLPLVMMLAVFFTKYVASVTLAVAPQLRHDTLFAAAVCALFGVYNGWFAGRLARRWPPDRRTQPVS